MSWLPSRLDTAGCHQQTGNAGQPASTHGLPLHGEVLGERPCCPEAANHMDSCLVLLSVLGPARKHPQPEGHTCEAAAQQARDNRPSPADRERKPAHKLAGL